MGYASLIFFTNVILEHIMEVLNAQTKKPQQKCYGLRSFLVVPNICLCIVYIYTHQSRLPARARLWYCLRIMQQDLKKFIRKYRGKKVQAPGGLGGQCVDLVVLWMNKQGLDRIWAHAVDFPKHATEDMPFIPNRAGNRPKPGDVMIWNGRVGRGYGHNSIFVRGTRNKFLSFDQNWPTGSPANLVSHGSQNLAGWLSLQKVGKKNKPKPKKRQKVVMQEGDTVWDIAQKYGLDHNKLLEINDINDPHSLPVGFELYLE